MAGIWISVSQQNVYGSMHTQYTSITLSRAQQVYLLSGVNMHFAKQ